MDCVESDCARKQRLLRELYRSIYTDATTSDENADLGLRALSHLQNLIEIIQECS